MGKELICDYCGEPFEPCPVKGRCVVTGFDLCEKCEKQLRKAFKEIWNAKEDEP